MPVSGTVMLDGKPLAGVKVTFIPVGSTPGGLCSGITDQSGRYELKDDRNRMGAQAGEFIVTCDNRDPGIPEDPQLPVEKGPPPAAAGGKVMLPPRYAHEPTTELKATVPPGGGTIDFELVSDG
jgi:hypothetical protein